MKRILIAAALFPLLAAAQTLPNAVPMPSAAVQFVDQNGLPLAGGKLYTCFAGLSCPGNPQATYTDSTASVQNTNPIVLDAAGRAQVWIGSLAYRLVLQDANGVQQWTQDNVSDTTLYFVNFVKTAGTATLITYTPPGTGAVQRTVQSRLTDRISVKDYGAVGDGSTDDTAAITYAMAYGGTIWFPPGTYKVHNVPILNPVAVECANRNTTLISADNTATSALAITGTTDVSVRNCQVGNANTTTGNGISITNSSRIQIEDSYFKTIGKHAVQIVNSSYVWVDANIFNAIGQSPVRVDDPGTMGTNQYIWVRKNSMDTFNTTVTTGSGGISVYPNGTEQYMWFQDNMMTHPGTTGIEANLITYGFIDHNTIVGNGTVGECISFVGSRNQVTRNIVSGCGSSGVMLFAVNDEGSMDWNTIDGNLAWDNKSQGIAVVFGKNGTSINHLQITNNRTFDSGGGNQHWGIQSFCNSAGGSCLNGDMNGITWTDSNIAFNDLAYNANGPINLAAMFVPSTNVNQSENFSITAQGLNALGYIGPIDVQPPALDTPTYQLSSSCFGSGGAVPCGINFKSNNATAARAGFSGTSNLLALDNSQANGAVQINVAAQAAAITITAISTASQAVLSVASIPAGLTAGNTIFLQGVAGTGCFLNGAQSVVSVGGSTITIAASGAGCAYTGSSGTFTSLLQAFYVEKRGAIPGVSTFANLSAANLTLMIWCSDCNVVATPFTCTGGGTGAWAFKNAASGIWKCPF